MKDLGKLKYDIHKLNKKAKLADGFDDALIGICTIPTSKLPVAAYSTHKIIDTLMKESEMDYEEAAEYFSFNIACAYVGEGTPVFLDILDIISTIEEKVEIVT